VVATNSGEVADLASLGVHRSAIGVVPWGVDTDLFTPEGPVARRNGRPRLLTAADLTQRLPLETLLRALTRVPGTELLLLVVGGPDEAELASDDSYVKLAKFAATLGITDRVIFTGKVEHAAMPALLRSADLVDKHEPVRAFRQHLAAGHGVRHAGHRAPGRRARGRRGGRDDDIIPSGRPALLARHLPVVDRAPLLKPYELVLVDRVRSRYSWDRIAGGTIAVYDRVAAQAA
jgi:D-inositol-3-phosphate glycosyltransferase